MLPTFRGPRGPACLLFGPLGDVDGAPSWLLLDWGPCSAARLLMACAVPCTAPTGCPASRPRLRGVSGRSGDACPPLPPAPFLPTAPSVLCAGRRTGASGPDLFHVWNALFLVTLVPPVESGSGAVAPVT